jgi:chemotaxis signal transduction protein
MAQINSTQTIDINALKAQVDAEIAARLQVEADYARHIHRRGFHVGDLRLLVDMDATSEVLDMPPLFRLPGAPRGIKGLVNRHGRVVPVIDIPDLFGHQTNRAKHSWLLVCGRGDEAVGIIIDSLPERKKFIQDDRVDLEEITHPITAHAKRAYREGKDIWIDLDTGALFDSVFHVDTSSA